jgi:hypothetical protein
LSSPGSDLSNQACFVDKADNRTGIFHTINGETREIVVELPDRGLLAA